MSTDGIPLYRPRLGRLLGVQIASVGGFVPANVVTNRDLVDLGCDEEWILQRTGIRQRRKAPADMATSDLAIQAARECIQKADVNPLEIDLLLVATFTPDMPVPSTACLVQSALGLQGPAMDLQAACSGFVYGLTTGAQFIGTGNARNVLVVGADCNTRVVNPEDKKTYPLFGDGAGAVLLKAGDKDQGLLRYALGADGRGAELLCQRMGGSRLTPAQARAVPSDYYLHMDGRAVFKWAVRLVVDSIQHVLDSAQVGVNDVSWFAPHQANLRIIEAVAEELGINRNKVWVNLDRLGNTSAASIPLCLKEMVEEDKLVKGQLVLMCGFGAGLTWGTALFRW